MMVLRPREAQRFEERTVILTRNHARWIVCDGHKRKEEELSIFHRSSRRRRRRRRIVGRTSLDGGNKAGEKKRAESEKKVKGNGKRETRIQGGRGRRKAEGLKSINFKSQSRRLTVITLVAGTFASRYTPSEETKRLALEQSMLLGPRRARNPEGGAQKETKGSQGARDAAKEIDVIRFSNSR